MSKNKEQHTSLSEVHGSIKVDSSMSFKRRLLAFLGPAYMVSVGYMDPGNWATDIAGGSQFGYSLIWVLLMSNLMALLLQSLSVRLGIVRGRDLAQASREMFPGFVNIFLYVLAEIAIAACDLAEVLGMAIGLYLLFDLPLMYGVVISALDTFLLLFLMNHGIRKMEVFIISLVATIGLAFVAQMVIAQPVISEVMTGFIPTSMSNTALYIAIGIIGATVMPHNLYLHSALVQTRKFDRTDKEISRAIKFNILDSTIALNAAFFVNAAILILAASTFYKVGMHEVNDIMDAHRLLEPLLGSKLAPILFAVALLCAGQSSTITGTLAGQIVMEGYLNLRIAPWIRRLITRLIAIIPAVLVIHIAGESATTELLIFSQVILSLQLGFAVIPLIHFVSDRSKMGNFTISLKTKIAAWLCAIIIVSLNVKLVFGEVTGWLNADDSIWLRIIVVPLCIFVGIMLLYITFAPIFRKMKPKSIYLPHGSFQEIKLQEASKYNRIAVTLDFGSMDGIALQNAVNQGGKEAIYILVHISESAIAHWMGSDSSDFESIKDTETLVEYKKQMIENGYNCEIELGFGNPRKAIPQIVKNANADLLVMGAHGHKAIMDFILGSSVDAVRHQLEIPVLVVTKESVKS
ncbi:MAG: Nramp family divalent metal transporter [Bacteroidia bacterium]|nr:Nramp family divalent metal transporter [Bacteroidia bacterium]MBP7245944.1 Nramp family divalent metal transporter [Bacteroidia bacterium]